MFQLQYRNGHSHCILFLLWNSLLENVDLVAIECLSVHGYDSFPFFMCVKRSVRMSVAWCTLLMAFSVTILYIF
jgi:hypothetical protein